MLVVFPLSLCGRLEFKMANFFSLHKNMKGLGKKHKNNSLGKKTTLPADLKLGKPASTSQVQ